MRHIYRTLGILIICLLLCACGNVGKDIEPSTPPDESMPNSTDNAQNSSQNPVTDDNIIGQDDTLPSVEHITLPDDISKITVSLNGGDTIRFSYTDKDKIKAVTDYFEALELTASAKNPSEYNGSAWVITAETSSGQIDLSHFGNLFFTVHSPDGARDVYEMVYKQAEAFDTVLKNNIPDILPDKYESIIYDEWKPTKITMYDNVFTAFSNGTTGWAPSKTIEITEQADIIWWYNALSRKNLTPDGTLACRCGPAYYIDFGNGYALLAHSHNDRYMTGSKVIVGDHSTKITNFDQFTAYTLSPDTHQKLKDLFK